MKLKPVGVIVTTSLSIDGLITESKAQQLIDYHQIRSRQYQAKRCVGMGIEHVLCFERVDQAYDFALTLIEDYPTLAITLHLGEVRYSDQDVFGNAVEGAWYMQAFCDAGAILLSTAVYNQLSLQPCRVQLVEENADIYRLLDNGRPEVNLKAS